MIKALLPGGFQVGTTSNVNAGLVANSYHYVAIKKIPGRFNTGVYDGNNVVPREITGVGFQPSYGDREDPHQRSGGSASPDSLAGTDSLYYVDTAKDVKIAALKPDGFRLGAVANVNAAPTATSGSPSAATRTSARSAPRPTTRRAASR